ncbi:MAG: hypothetical protein CMF81_07100 [Candidatus Marinimicrobia bacterium]|nr:hypothetical protein [Candidatus Neomarinimicrobiota bacterium]
MDGIIVANATDNGGIAKYEFSIGTVKGSDNVVSWAVSDSNVAHFDVKELGQDTTYYSNARVTDFVGFTTTASSDSFRMDFTPPTTGFLTIGDGLYQSDSANVKFTWGGFLDDQSGIGDFEYSLGTEPGSDNVIARKPVGLNVADFASISLTFGGMALIRNTTYYGTIYSLDKVGNESSAISDGLTIDRDGPTTGTVADGMGEDVDHLNDTTKASANWTGFYDFNGIKNFELSLNTTTNTGTEVIVADWTDVGKDSSFTFTGLNLITGKKYYFSVKGSDGLGNKSNIAVSDGFVIDLNGPEVANLSPSSSKLVSVLDSLHVVVTLDEEISKTNIEYASNQADILNIDPTFTVDKNIIKISFKPPFTSGDQIKIMIQNTDLAGNVSPTLEYIYNIAYLGDFDFEEGINWKDLNIFVEAWNKNDLSKELGPVNGIPPYFRPNLDRKFNTRDAMAFVRMWNWDKAQKSGKLIAKVLPTEGSALAADFEADHMLIHPPKGTKAMELILNYPVMDMSMGMPIKESVTEQAITLSKVDTVSGQILLNTAYFVKNDLPIRIDLKHLQRDNAVPVDISYQFIGNNNEILSSGNEVLDIKPVPKEFALHNNYPNPFNPVTTINYDLAKEGNVSLVVYDIMGREVIRLNDSFMPAGYHTVRWNARNQYGMEVSAGVYFYHIQAGDFVKTQKMILLK